MNYKFIRITSPIALIISIMIDISAVFFGIAAVLRLMRGADFYSISFIIIEVIMIAVAALSTRELLKSGARLYDDKIEFTALDENNVYYYSEIERLAAHRDSKASFKMNLVERYSSLIFYLKDGSVATVELGVTTQKALDKIENEINKVLKINN